VQTLPTIILDNNKGLIALAKNSQFYKRAKHIGVQYHSIREPEKVREGEITVESCRSQQQTVDVLIKPLLQAKHKQHVTKIGLAVA
jgi:hypothetical protein